MSHVAARRSPLDVIRALRAQRKAGAVPDAAAEASCRRALAEALEPRQMLSVTQAFLNGPATVVEGTPAVFHPNASTDHDPAPTYWSIQWGDGTSQTLTVNGSTSLTHTYGDEGTTYLPVATVSDSTGSGSVSYYYCSQSVSVTDAQLSERSMTSLIQPQEGQPFTGTVAKFDDPGGGAASDFSATVTLGSSVLPSSIVADPGGGYDVFVNNQTFIEEGSLAGSVSIHDDGGQTLGFSISATVTDAPLSAAGTDISYTTGYAFYGTVATFTDADPGGQQSDYTASINWGDGATAAGEIAINDGGGFSVVGNHIYKTDGPYSPTITIQDVGGATAQVTINAATSTAKITVTPNPVDLSITAGSASVTAQEVVAGTAVSAYLGRGNKKALVGTPSEILIPPPDDNGGTSTTFTINYNGGGKIGDRLTFDIYDSKSGAKTLVLVILVR